MIFIQNYRYRLLLLLQIITGLYTDCLDTFQTMAMNEEYTKREKTGEVQFIYKTFICLETIINKFQRLLYNLMENKKNAGMSDK